MKKAKFKKRIAKKPRRKGNVKIPAPGAYGRILTADIETGHPRITFIGSSTAATAPKTLKTALKRIAVLEESRKNEKREHEAALKAKDLENVTLRLQHSDHVMNRILNIMEEGSKKANFPIRNS